MTVDAGNIKSLQAYTLIRNLILSGTKLPGTRLVLAELEQELQIGRGPIRDALMRLDRSGLVKNIPYKGAVVANAPKLKEIRFVYELRVDVELKLAREAMDNLAVEDFADLEALNAEMEPLYLTGGNFFSLDQRFHRRLYAAAQLPHLDLIAQKLLESVEIFLNIYHYEPSDCTLFVKEHKTIVQALKDKNFGLVESTLRANILGGLALIDRIYSEIPARPS